jgi:hypothetical protein
MPAHHKLEAYLDEYLRAAGIGNEPKSALFRSARGRTDERNGELMHWVDAYRVQRRAAELGLKVRIGCHTFRATGIRTRRAPRSRRGEASPVATRSKRSSTPLTVLPAAMIEQGATTIPVGRRPLGWLGRDETGFDIEIVQTTAARRLCRPGHEVSGASAGAGRDRNGCGAVPTAGCSDHPSLIHHREQGP